MSKLNTYTLVLSAGAARDGAEVRLSVQADSHQSADELAEALARLMPIRDYYCEKNSCYLAASWHGYAEVPA